MTEIKTYESDIVFKKSELNFVNYKKILNEAKEVAKFLSTVEVTSETVKEAKKIRASANKAVNRLQDERKRIKKELLEPYEVFNKQVQEIVNVVDEANKLVDEQIKELEQKERDRKYDEIVNIWNLQTNQFKYKDLIDISMFIKNEYGNKTYSLNKIEEEMVTFLENSEREIDYVKSHGEEYLEEYLKVLDVIQAINNVDERKRNIELLKTNNEYDDVVEVVEIPTAIFEIKGNAEIKLVEKLLKENEIEYRKINK